MGLDPTFQAGATFNVPVDPPGTFNLPVDPPELFFNVPVDEAAWDRADRADRAELVARVEAALELLHAVELQLVEILAALDVGEPAGP
jgi:hypothetical protein